MKKIIFYSILLSSFLIVFNGCFIPRKYYDLITYNSPTPLVFEVQIDTIKINKLIGVDASFIEGEYEGENAFVFVQIMLILKHLIILL